MTGGLVAVFQSPGHPLEARQGNDPSCCCCCCRCLQVRRDACQALAVLAASLQFRSLPPLDSGQPAPAQPELVLTPAVELLIAQKPAVVQVRAC